MTTALERNRGSEGCYKVSRNSDVVLSVYGYTSLCRLRAMFRDTRQWCIWTIDKLLNPWRFSAHAVEVASNTMQFIIVA
jgi:hypothetical protein